MWLRHKWSPVLIVLLQQKITFIVSLEEKCFSYVAVLIKIGGMGGKGNQRETNNKTCEIHLLRIIIISKQYIKVKMYNCLPLIRKFLQTYVLNKIK